MNETAGPFSLPIDDQLEDVLERCRNRSEKAFAEAEEATRVVTEQSEAVLSGARRVYAEFQKEHEDAAGVAALQEVVDLLDGEIDAMTDTSASDLEVKENRLDRFTVALMGKDGVGKAEFLEALTGQKVEAEPFERLDFGPLTFVVVPGLETLSEAGVAGKARFVLARSDFVIFLWKEEELSESVLTSFRRFVEHRKPVICVRNVAVPLTDDEGQTDPEAIRSFLDNVHDHFYRRDFDSEVSLLRRVMGKDIPGQARPFPPIFNFIHVEAALLVQRGEAGEFAEALEEQSRVHIFLNRLARLLADEGLHLRLVTLFDGTRLHLDNQKKILRVRRKVLRDSAIGVFDRLRAIDTWFEEMVERLDDAIAGVLSRVYDRAGDDEEETTPDDVREELDTARLGSELAALIDGEAEELASTVMGELLTQMQKVQERSKSQAEFQGFDEIDLGYAIRWARAVAEVVENAIRTYPREFARSLSARSMEAVTPILEQGKTGDELKKSLNRGIRDWLEKELARGLKEQFQQALWLLKEGFFKIADEIWARVGTISSEIDDFDLDMMIAILREEGFGDLEGVLVKIAREPGERIKAIVGDHPELEEMKGCVLRRLGEWVTWVPESADLKESVLAAVDVEGLDTSMLRVIPAQGKRRTEIILKPPKRLVGFILGRKRANQRLAQRLLGVTIRVVGDRRERRRNLS